MPQSRPGRGYTATNSPSPVEKYNGSTNRILGKIGRRLEESAAEQRLLRAKEMTPAVWQAMVREVVAEALEREKRLRKTREKRREMRLSREKEAKAKRL